MTTARAVVFGYHDVGVRCLKTLISGGVEIPLVVTVADDPGEAQWFGSVAATAAEYGIPAITPADANTTEMQQRLSELRPDFIFSFYYRSMLGSALLNCAQRGALNMHGSLLPRYRGRAPVNWAILNGEKETGATLHYMAERADAGEIVDQLAVPILQDDDARQVFSKVTVAAEMVLARSLPGLVAGTAPRHIQPIVPGEYYGRRRPEDGRIDWTRPAREIHNLVRAVAPPFPGAFTEVGEQRWWIHRTRVVEGRAGGGAAAGAHAGSTAGGATVGAHAGSAAAGALGGSVAPSGTPPRLVGDGQRCYIECADGGVLLLLEAATDTGPINLTSLAAHLQGQPLAVG